MTDSTQWRELCRCETALQARRIATSVASMEFPVQLVLTSTGQVLQEESPAQEGDVAVQVPAEFLNDLADILDEIIDEQAEFDADARFKEGQRRRWQRIAMALIVTSAVVLVLWRWVF